MRFVFGLLFACSSSAPRERSPQPPPADASIDAPVDAPADAASVVYGACDWNKPDPNNPRCAPEHMPLMRCRDVNGPNDRFPKCIEDTKVVEAPKPIVLGIKRRGEVTDRGIRIIVDGGTNRGIDKSWRADLLDAKQRALHGGRATFVRLDPDEIEVLARISADQIDTLVKAVRFTPPKP
jgi:hypothetical protein